MPTKNPELRKHHNRKYYEKNKDRVRERNAVARAKNKAFITELKESNPCVDCNNFYPAVCMDFDHLPGIEKINNLSIMANSGFSLEALQKEIDKCELVCANCHRIRSRDRQAAQVLR
jgi:hypothetical protein